MGGFLESILAVMTVITASSLFLVMLSVGAVQSSNGGVDIDHLVSELQDQGLWPDEDDRLDVECLEARFSLFVVPAGTFFCIAYRSMGEHDPFLTFGELPPKDATLNSAQAPALMNIDGRAVPGMVEVLVW